MLYRVGLMALAVATCAGCATTRTPSVDGKDALGQPIYTLSGGSLSQLELTANSNCSGNTRPYYKTVTGHGNDMSVSYTCE
ncbi:hypothetical protein GCM10011611_41200 [Aliidongia dinghuensis]|uniref:Uncharacterized protein n=1 Tax=Aliidongia dinghuensis TaxID=1867774 RepID=A0A8J2YW78_9PROT|nr:hypothetical protein [Aliidongia dinghuensis]GGF30878.1 hypothetical protein GCM10011611_41200 [Aliidongia dinghuensis]